MFIGVYLGLCGIQYLIILMTCLILIRRKVSSSDLQKSIWQYSLLALSASLLGLVLFSLITIPVGNLHFNLPQDLTDPKLLIRSMPKIFTILLGLAGVTAPVWSLFLIFPKPKNR